MYKGNNKNYFFIGVTSEDKSPIPLDGHDVWETISLGKPSPRTEILHNIDNRGSVPPGPGILGGYSGVALRMGEMKLLMNVPNVTWFKPPELGGKPVRGVPLNAEFQFSEVVRLSLSLLCQCCLFVSVFNVSHGTVGTQVSVSLSSDIFWQLVTIFSWLLLQLANQNCL